MVAFACLKSQQHPLARTVRLHKTGVTPASFHRAKRGLESLPLKLRREMPFIGLRPLWHDVNTRVISKKCIKIWKIGLKMRTFGIENTLKFK